MQHTMRRVGRALPLASLSLRLTAIGPIASARLQQHRGASGGHGRHYDSSHAEWAWAGALGAVALGLPLPMSLTSGCFTFCLHYMLTLGCPRYSGETHPSTYRKMFPFFVGTASSMLLLLPSARYLYIVFSLSFLHFP